jgi:thiamine kinase-like enzyme
MSCSDAPPASTTNVQAVNSSNNKNALLLSLLQSAIPTIVECTILDTIVQANAQGCRVTATHVNKENELFVKQIKATDYLLTKSSWNDLRRTLIYGRTETRFYKEILPLLVRKGFPDADRMVPTCHVAVCNLHEHGLIRDDSVAYEDDHVTTMPTMEQAANHGAFLVLDSIDMQEYYQTSPLTRQEALKCLEALAHLHAAAWQDVDMLRQANTRMARGSYHLSTRNPKELHRMVESWKHFCHEFQHLPLIAQPSIQALGRRMQQMAEYISQQLIPSPEDQYATLTHGDFKAMNVFLPVDNEKPAVMIDYASTGVGNAMSDVAMHVIHAVQPSDGGDDKEEELVDEYLTMLEKARKRYHRDAPPYPREVALRHYRLACCDYIRFIMGRFWKSATVASIELKKDSMNVTLVNRNVDAAMAWIQKVDTYLQEFEDEKAAMNDKN